MKQEQKELLLKELCTRWMHGVKVNAPFTGNKSENAKGYKITGINFRVVEWTPVLFGEKKRRNSIIIEAFSEKYNQYCAMDLELNNHIEEVKLYLFPLSSMTEEQKLELTAIKTYVSLNKNKEYLLFDWLNANHIDWRGLIPSGLAIDATNLNIY